MNKFKLSFLFLLLPCSFIFATEMESNSPSWNWMGNHVRYDDLALDPNFTLECFDIKIMTSGIGIGTEAGAAQQAENTQIRFTFSAQDEVATMISKSSHQTLCSKNGSVLTSEMAKKIAELEGVSASIYYEIAHRIGWYKDSFGFEEKEDFGIYQKCVIGLRKYEVVRQIQAVCQKNN